MKLRGNGDTTIRDTVIRDTGAGKVGTPPGHDAGDAPAGRRAAFMGGARGGGRPEGRWAASDLFSTFAVILTLFGVTGYVNVTPLGAAEDDLDALITEVWDAPVTSEDVAPDAPVSPGLGTLLSLVSSGPPVPREDASPPVPPASAVRPASAPGGVGEAAPSAAPSTAPGAMPTATSVILGPPIPPTPAVYGPLAAPGPGAAQPTPTAAGRPDDSSPAAPPVLSGQPAPAGQAPPPPATTPTVVPAARPAPAPGPGMTPPPGPVVVPPVLSAEPTATPAPAAPVPPVPTLVAPVLPAPTLVVPVLVPTLAPTLAPPTLAPPTPAPPAPPVPTAAPPAPTATPGQTLVTTPPATATPVRTPTPVPENVIIRTDAPATAFLEMGRMSPGAWATRSVSVFNSGRQPFLSYTLTTAATDAPTLLWTDPGQGLQLRVRRGTTVIYEGPIAVRDLDLGTTVAPGGTDVIELSVYLPDHAGNIVQGLTQTISITWTATST